MKHSYEIKTVYVGHRVYKIGNGELKKAYEIQKDSLTNMANSPWAKLVIGMLTSKVQEDKVDVELPDIDALIKENTSDEFIERKINDILGIKEK